jgi:hypothetical protein
MSIYRCPFCKGIYASEGAGDCCPNCYEEFEYRKVIGIEEGAKLVDKAKKDGAINKILTHAEKLDW